MQTALDFAADMPAVTDTALYKLQTAPIPERTDSYTPIAHGTIIESTQQLLKNMNFKITRTQYRASTDGMIGQGEYHIQYGNDTEMGLMLAWQNSYNKTTSFKYAIGAHVFVCANGMVAGDLASYRRKHTGSADQEAFEQIYMQITEAKSIFDKLITDREQLKPIGLSEREIAEIMGRLYVEKQIITSTQLNIMKRELEKPSFDYGVPGNSAWSLYNYATHSFKEDNPRNWIKRHVDLHDFFGDHFQLEGYTPADPQPQVFTMEQPIGELVLAGSRDSVDDMLDMF